MSADKISNDDLPIENATAVIERFGGIRPMAKKIDVAVTTIQGWKKRDVIPGPRREQVLEAAQEHDVDLSDLVQDIPAANQNAPSFKEAIQEAPEDMPLTAPKFSETAQRPAVNAEALEKELARLERKSASTSTWIMAVLLMIALGGAALVLWPRTLGDNSELSADRLAAIEENLNEIEVDVAEVKQQQSFFGTIVPENLEEQINELREQAGQVQADVNATAQKAQEISRDVLAQDGSNLEERVARLEGHLADIAGSPVLTGVMERINAIRAQPEGSALLNRAMEELSAIAGSFEGQPEMLEGALVNARAQSTALSETFAGVPADDLKAATLLLSMSQFRESLNRNQESFANDLQVLKNLSGPDNQELQAAIDRLAPHAESGVLTPEGLTNEFKTLAGEAVVASLQGEDVSLGERAAARLNEIVQIEKDGELITGTPTQAKVAKAENLLEQGELAAAIAQVQMLDGPAAEKFAGWLEQANARLEAQQLLDVLMQGGILNPAALSGGMMGSSRLIQNEETGINVLKPAIPQQMPGN